MSIFMSPMRPSIGASAGAFGLLAASVVFGWKHGGQIPKKAAKFFGWGVLPYLVFSLSMGFNSSSVDNWGHIGGLLTGGLLATFLEPEAYTSSASSNNRLRVFTASIMGLISAIFVVMGADFVGLEQHEERGFTSAHPVTWERNWTPSGDRGWVSPSFRASIVSKTAQYEHALSISGAVDAFSGQIEVWGDDVTLINSQAVAWGPFSGMEVEYMFTIRGAEQGLRAVVLPRGRYLHMIYVQTDFTHFHRYSDLSRRLFEHAKITPPPGLSRARSNALAPGSGHLDFLALGVEAGRAGYYLEASQAFNSVLSEAATLTTGGSDSILIDAALGLMALYIDYGAGVSIEEVRGIAQRFSMVSSIQLGASRVLSASGQGEEAAQILSQAWARGLQDYSIREALVELGASASFTEDPE
jgi:hypothetical protein